MCVLVCCEDGGGRRERERELREGDYLSLNSSLC